MARRTCTRESDERENSPRHERGVSPGAEIPHVADDGGRKSGSVRDAIFKVQLQSSDRQSRKGVPHYDGVGGPVPDIGVSCSRDGTPNKRGTWLEVGRPGL